jgi:hypothetical protein
MPPQQQALFVACNFMTTLVSERHKLNFYLTIILGSLFFLAMGTGMLIVYFKHSSNGQLKAKDQLMPFFSISVFFLAIYTVYKYYRNAPIIRIDNSTISFNNQSFTFSDLEHIDLTGIRSFPYLFGFPMEAATLKFKDGQTKYIFDSIYENSWQLKSFLKQVVIDKTEFTVQSPHNIDKSELDNEYYDTFKGNQFTSLRGILLWGAIGFFTYAVLTSKTTRKTASLIVYIFFSFLWFFLLSLTMNYFQVSQNYLVIKNHNLLWRRKAYRLSDIKEVTFETQGKMPNCLRVITKDFRNKLYLAATLGDKTWLELKDKLESYNITVRNECIR